jgi:multisubunit Na+/H+ antiporter MnhG subunit
VRDAVALGLTFAGVLVQVACCLGVAAMRAPLARLHYTAPGVVAAALVGAGLLVRDGLSQTSGRGLLLVAVLAVGGPVQAHVTARAIRLRGGGPLGPEGGP